MRNREREREILSILKNTGGFVSTGELCERLFASESSIRRDLKLLEEGNLIKRSHGGAMPVAGFSNIVTFNQRTKQNAGAKREIAKKAAALIGEGEIVFLDQSSTAFYLADELSQKSGITVITNNIEILMLLSSSHLKLISSGGMLSDENRNCLIGGDACATFENVYADFMFFSTKCLSREGLVTDCSREEIVVRNAMRKNAKTKVLLCDSSKFDRRAPYVQCELKEVDCFISEGEQAKSFASQGESLCLL